MERSAGAVAETSPPNRFELGYSAPAGCPAEADVRPELSAWLVGQPPGTELLWVTVHASQGSFHGRVEIRTAIATDSVSEPRFLREIRGADCRELVAALLLSVTLHLESQGAAVAEVRAEPALPASQIDCARQCPGRSPETLETADPPDPIEPPPPKPPPLVPPVSLLVGAGAGVRTRWAPGIDPSFDLVVGLAGTGDGLKGARFLVGPRTRFLRESHDGWVHQWSGAVAQVCPLAFHVLRGRVGFLPCVAGSVGLYEADSDVFEEDLVAGSVDLLLEVQVRADWFSLAGVAGLGFPLSPIRVQGPEREIFAQTLGAVAGLRVDAEVFRFFADPDDSTVP